MKKKLLQNMLITTSFLMALLLSHTGQAETYRWVDEKGVIHYGDQIPPEYLNEGYSIMNKSGVTTKQVEQVQSADERESAERQALIEQEKTEQKRKQIANDRNLISTYTTEQDLVDTRDRHISTLEGLIKVSEFKLTGLQTKLEELSKMAEALKVKGAAPREDITQNIKIIERQIAEEKDAIQNRRDQQQVLREKYAKDITRYRELTGSKSSASPNSN